VTQLLKYQRCEEEMCMAFGGGRGVHSSFSLYRSYCSSLGESPVCLPVVPSGRCAFLLLDVGSYDLCCFCGEGWWRGVCSTIFMGCEASERRGEREEELKSDE